MPLRSLTLVAGILICAVASAQETYYDGPDVSSGAYVEGDVGSYVEPAPINSMGYQDAMPGPYQSMMSPMMGEFGPPVPQGDLPPIPESWLNSMWEPQPRIEISGEALFAQPNMPSSINLANQVTFPQGLTGVTTKFHQPWITGARLTGEVHLNTFWSVIGSAMIVDGPNRPSIPLGAQDLTYFVSDINGIGTMSNVPASFPTQADSLTMDWDLETYSGDINLVMHCIPLKGPLNDFAIGGGCRYLRIDDKVSVTYNDELNAIVGTMSARSRNDIIGPQLYSRLRLQLAKRIRCSWESKVALAANFVDDYTGVSPNATTITRSTTQFTPVFEGNATFEFFVINHVSLYAGFYMLYADQVDRGADQFNNNLNNFGDGSKRSGDYWMFGPRVGGTFTY